MAAEPLTTAGARRRTRSHPQQRLWNRALVAAIETTFARVPSVAALLVWLVMIADTLMLLGRVLRRRVRLLGARSLDPRPRGGGARVLYIDCGVHEQGLEIRLMSRWFARRHEVQVIAFEAGSTQFSAARESLQDVPNLDLRHQALVGPDHETATVTLFRSAGGYADSIFAADGPDCEEVPAGRLSEVLLCEHPAHDGPVILRMNIEGAELAVLEDLVDAGLDGRIDGYYGMWDDLSRIDAQLDARLRALLADRAIDPLTFNGRDLGYALRRLAIRTDVQTSIRLGERRGPRSIADTRKGCDRK